MTEPQKKKKKGATVEGEGIAKKVASHLGKLYNGGFAEAAIATLQEEGLRAKEPLLYALQLHQEKDKRYFMEVPLCEEAIRRTYPRLTDFCLCLISWHPEELSLLEGVVRTKSGPVKLGRWIRKVLIPRWAPCVAYDAAYAYEEVVGPVRADELPGENDPEGWVRFLEKRFLPKLGGISIKHGSHGSGSRVMISWNVWDFLGCSTGTDYTSCYQVGGAFFAMTTTLVVDRHTLVVYYMIDGKRKGRVFFHFASGFNAVLQSRVYGIFPEAALEKVREFFVTRLDYKVKWVTEDLWESPIGYRLVKKVPETFHGYLDVEHPRYGVLLMYKKKAPPFEVVLFLPPPTCLGCGSRDHVSSYGICKGGCKR